MDRDLSDSSDHPAQHDAGADADDRNDPPAPSIPDHQLLRCIGRGSYGEVWLARNMMGVYRAVKIVYRRRFNDQRPFERELSGIRKFEPVSRSHEGFIDVLHVGINEEEGYFYYVMELGDDQTAGQRIDPETYSSRTLAKEIAQHGRLPVQDVLELGLALSRSLAELHKNGLVHRDIKPSNIILVNGVPKLADIGLVTGVAEAQSYVGTEGFIPPEGPGTMRSDLYSLGKVLYEASTGMDRQEFPELPTKLGEFSDHETFLELNEIVLHACKNDPGERYQSAWDMHADLVFLTNGKSVRRLKVLERRLANLKRLAGISILILAVVTAVLHEVYRDYRESVESRQRKVDAYIASGNRAMYAGDLQQALPSFMHAFLLDRGNRGQEATHRLRIGSIIDQLPKLTQMFFPGVRMDDGEFSPDGQRILVAGFDRKTYLYNLRTGSVQRFGTELGVMSASFSHDGKYIATASMYGPVRVWDAATLKELAFLPHDHRRVFSARFSPDGLRIVTACEDCKARVWNWRTRRIELLLQHNAGVLFAAYSHNGKLIVTTSYDGTARLWNANDGEPIGNPLVHPNWVNYAAFSPDDRRVVTACADRKARVWDVQTMAQIGVGLNSGDIVKNAEYSPDGRTILTAGFDGSVRLWRADDLQPCDVNSRLEQGEPVTHASFGPDGRRIVVTCTGGPVKIWDLAGSAVPSKHIPCVYSEDGNKDLRIITNTIQVLNALSNDAVCGVINAKPALESAHFNRNGDFVISVSKSGTSLRETNRVLQIWNALTDGQIGDDVSIPHSYTGASLSDDGKRLVVFGGNDVHVWALPAAKMLASFGLAEPVTAAVFSPAGDRIMTTTTNGTQVCVWDATDGQLKFTLQHTKPISYAGYSPNGLYLVTCCADPRVSRCNAQIWNAHTGVPIGTPLRHKDGVLYASFSPDSRRVVTASEDFTAIIWDVATGAQLTQPLVHQDQVVAANYSPDGKWIVTASRDKTARVWNAETGDPITPPLPYLTKLKWAQFDDDGRRIVVSDAANQSWTWQLPVDNKPVTDLMDFTRLLSGNTSVSIGGSDSTNSERFEAVWNRSRAKYFSNFTVSTEEIEAWNLFEAQDSEREHHWSAAVFHWSLLHALRPDDPFVARRFVNAKEHLQNGAER